MQRARADLTINWFCRLVARYFLPPVNPSIPYNMIPRRGVRTKQRITTANVLPNEYAVLRYTERKSPWYQGYYAIIEGTKRPGAGGTARSTAPERLLLMLLNDTPPIKSIPESRKPYWSDGLNSYAVNLTQGQVALIDEDDAGRIGEYKWFAQNSPSGFYAATGSSRRRERISMAAFIMNPAPGMVVDHRNHNTLDNRKSNLRVCSRRENCMNRKGLTAHNSSGYLGVTLEKSTEKWKAAITVNGKRRTVGRFNTVDEAVLARDIAAFKCFGEFARLNIRDLTN